MHLYAPGDHDYKAVDWSLEETAGIAFEDASYPAGEWKHLPAIQETVPVYHEGLKLVRDVHLVGSPRGTPRPEAVEEQDELVVVGTFRYQACDARGCYPPKSIPLRWTFKPEEHDRERSPENIRRGADEEE